MDSNLLLEILEKLNDLDKKIISLETKIDSLETKVTTANTTLTNHIGFVDNVFASIKSPLFFIMNKVNRTFSLEIEDNKTNKKQIE